MIPVPQNYQQHRVLFVDDEVPMLRALSRALSDQRFGKEYCESVQDALNALQNQRFTVVVTDLKMPGTSGLEFLSTIKREYPKMIRIIATGVTDLKGVLMALRTGETHRYIGKPINIEEELVPTLHQAFDLYDMQRTQERLTEELLQLNNFLQHQKEEIAFFKELSEQSNRKKEQILRRINTIFPQMMGFLVKMAQVKGPAPQSLIDSLDSFLLDQAHELETLQKEINESDISLEFQTQLTR